MREQPLALDVTITEFGDRNYQNIQQLATQ